MGVTAASVDGVVFSARTLLRDFPIFFEVDLGPVNTSTLRLPHPNVDGASVQVYFAPDAANGTIDSETVAMTPVDAAIFTIDERNGLLKFSDMTVLGKRCFVAGYHYEWFVTQDLSFYAQQMITEHLYGRTETIESISETELDIIAMGTLVRALWSLVTQFSTEIDVATPEGMNIPASSRFQQVWQLCQRWEAEYLQRAAALNVGLRAIRVYDLRRTSRQTGRLVPIYVPREYDDPRPARRVIPAITIPDTAASTSRPHWYSIEEIGREAFDFGFGTWRTLATSGGDLL